MKTLKELAVIVVAVMLPLSVAAQMADEAEVKEVVDKYDLGLTKRPGSSLLDLSRLDFSHSYTLGFFSGGGVSGSRGFYSGTVSYQIANPLTLTLNLGVLHDPGSLFGDKKFSDNAVFLPSGWLNWRPSKNFMMSIGFETVPASYYNSGGYYPFPGRSWYWRER